MNADRHALNAALEYSARQDQEIQQLLRNNTELRNENRDLRSRFRQVSDSLHGPDKAMPAEATARPMGMTPMPQPASVGHADEF